MKLTNAIRASEERFFLESVKKKTSVGSISRVLIKHAARGGTGVELHGGILNQQRLIAA